MKITKKLSLILISSLLFIFNLAKVAFADGSSTAINVIENSDLYGTAVGNSDPRQISANITNLTLSFFTIVSFVTGIIAGIQSFSKKLKKEEIISLRKSSKIFFLIAIIILLIFFPLAVLFLDLLFKS